MNRTCWKMGICFLLVCALFLPFVPTASAEEGGAEAGLRAVEATGDAHYLVLPEDEEYLDPFQQRYVRALIGPCAPVERVPWRRSGRLPMPFAYDGVRATVVAKHDEMSLILYLSNSNRLRAGWIRTVFLTDEYPGTFLTIGEEKTGDDVIPEVPISWSRRSFLTSAQNYSILEEPVENCVSFTLDYQLISENTEIHSKVLGPRTVYVNSGTEWIEIGTFDYPELGPVLVQVNLPEPMTVAAIGTIADCEEPNVFYFRQYAIDFQTVSD
ncbi:MAG: hypothetical protein IJQ02_06910 [Oscillospiraceae bacterium]|nr:hypothetical protein [Oscillospiraceae bacterium]MBR0393437.1 hypothetical protein [Oscillospiraceae bacterium]